MKKSIFIVLSVLVLSGCFLACGDEIRVYSCVDYDGNSYETVIIGRQVWMAENLKAVHATNGGKLYLPSEIVNWQNKDIGKRYYFRNDTSYLEYFGYLYNSLAIEDGYMAPTGWRVPTKEDWEVLVNYLKAANYSYEPSDTSNWVAKALASKDYWLTSTVVGSPGEVITTNNASGFNAQPGGCRSAYESYFGEKSKAYFWTSTIDTLTGRPFVVYIYNNENDLKQTSFESNDEACYIRCVRDVE